VFNKLQVFVKKGDSSFVKMTNLEIKTYFLQLALSDNAIDKNVVLVSLPQQFN